MILFDEDFSVFTLHCFASVWPGLLKRSKATALPDRLRVYRLLCCLTQLNECDLLTVKSVSKFGHQLLAMSPVDLCLVLLWVQNDWMGKNCFGRVQIILVRFKLDFSGLIFIIWTCPKLFWPNQNKLDPTKTICIHPKQF